MFELGDDLDARRIEVVSEQQLVSVEAAKVGSAFSDLDRALGAVHDALALHRTITPLDRIARVARDAFLHT